jgi:hypothetical protein
MKYEWRMGTCKQCSGWMYNINHDTLRYKPEKDYPVELFTENIVEGKLKPTIITKSNIQKQVNRLILLLKEKRIAIGEAKVFLRYVGIHNNEQKHILKNYNDIALYELPSAWYQSDSVSIFVDAPMHLLFLGLIKAVRKN